VDPSGRLGLVSGGSAALRYLELRAPRWGEADVQKPALPPRLTSTGKVVGAPAEGRGGQVSERHDWFWFISNEERVAVVRGDLAAEIFEPLPRKVIHSAFVDDAHDLLATASYGEIIVHRITGGVLHPVCYLKTTGTVTWISLAFPYLAALVGGGAEYGLVLWKIGSNPAIPSMLLHLPERVRTAALSRDGRYLAAAFDDHRVFVRDIENGGTTTFDDHASAVTLVKFVGAEALLVTGDDKGRVVLRAQAAGGYLRELVKVPIRDA
jgi:hypothetical protein